MTTPHQHRLETEHRDLRHAIARLLAGTPQRSDGTLSVTTLAVEAGLPRHRLYEHHADLLAEFKTRVGAGPSHPDITAVRRQLAGAHQRIHDLETTNTQLHNKITMLSAVITELTHEAAAHNVVPLPPRRRSTTPPARP